MKKLPRKVAIASAIGMTIASANSCTPNWEQRLLDPMPIRECAEKECMLFNPPDILKNPDKYWIFPTAGDAQSIRRRILAETDIETKISGLRKSLAAMSRVIDRSPWIFKEKGEKMLNGFTGSVQGRNDDLVILMEFEENELVRMALRHRSRDCKRLDIVYDANQGTIVLDQNHPIIAAAKGHIKVVMDVHIPRSELAAQTRRLLEQDIRRLSGHLGTTILSAETVTLQVDGVNSSGQILDEITSEPELEIRIPLTEPVSIIDKMQAMARERLGISTIVP
ncbi:hypothetical protein HZC07_00325 [Candidatus Micrarchaeota archaeon]|nr:hypothetical protein [Candidatus Micrarchaeota archaeon]